VRLERLPGSDPTPSSSRTPAGCSMRVPLNVPALWMQSVGGFSLGSMGGLALPLLFFAAMYFLLIAPNQKKQKAWQQMLGNIKAGDQVTTSGGLRGLVLSVKDDIVMVRVAPDNLRMEFVKSAIATVVTADPAA